MGGGDRALYVFTEHGAFMLSSVLFSILIIFVVDMYHIGYDMDIPANENIFCACARIFAVRQGRIDRCVLVAVRKGKPDAALR